MAKIKVENTDLTVISVQEESDHFKMKAGLPSFVLSASEWILKTKAIVIIVKKGKYVGTYAHKDIAFESNKI